MFIPNHLCVVVCAIASGPEYFPLWAEGRDVVIATKDEIALRKLKGRKIRFTGTLTHAITGHHHVPILMEVKAFKVELKSSGAPRGTKRAVGQLRSAAE